MKTQIILLSSLLVTSSLVFGEGRVIEISKENPRYFVTEEGKTWIPIGCNICWFRPTGESTAEKHASIRAGFDRMLRAFAANGGNCIRLWAGHRWMDVMPEKAGVYDPERTKTMKEIIRLCEELDIKVKITLESFRSCLFDASKANQPVFNRALYAPYAKTMPEFFASEECRRIYLGKAQYLKDCGFGDSPAVYCWEPWNEINATSGTCTWAPWSEWVLAELKKMFPRQMTVNNLGSFSDGGCYRAYDEMALEKDNDFLQVHRYLDEGADIDVCRGPMDLVAASAVQEMLDRRSDRPVILAETGAVKANHQGRFRHYDADKDGILLHDAVFAAFFAGSAGCGQFWHWDYNYIDKNDLWWQFGRFAKAIEGIDPVAEKMRPFHTETRRLRIFGLRGTKTAIMWCRDKQNSWIEEFEHGKAPETLTNERVPFNNCKLACYLPWEDRHVTVDAPVLPPFKRSIVLRVPASATEGVVRPH